MSKSDLPILYSFRRCPYAIRARIALEYADITCQLREVDLKDKPAHMIELSPKGTVPVLILPNGQIIDESLDVIAYALSVNDPDDVSVYTAQHKDDIENLISRNDGADGRFVYLLMRYKYHQNYDDITQGEMLAAIEDEFLDDFEQRLGKHRYLVSDHKTRADFAIVPFIRQFALAGKDYFYNSKYTNIQRWLAEFLDSKGFARVMVKHKPWQKHDKITLFPPQD